MIWTAEDEICPEITFLMEEKGLTLEPGHPECFFQAPLWGTKLSAARDAVLVFYETERDSEGNICDAEFNFVDREEFEKTYEVIPEKAAITAKPTDGSSVKKSVTLNVIYLDAAKTLTAKVENVPAIGLQPEQTTKMTVTGTSPIDAGKLSFSSSNESIASVC